MNDELFRSSLLAYALAYVVLAVVWRSFIVYHRTGANPFVPPSSDDPFHDCTGRRMPPTLRECAGDTDCEAPVNVTFREMCERDIDELLDVRAATRENALSREQLARMGITPASIAESLAGGSTKGWVCSRESRLVGFCMGDSDHGEVLVLAVLPEYERQGIGRTLLSLVVEWLCAFKPTRVWLGASRDPATRAYGFYRALGWQPSGETDPNGDEVLVRSNAPSTAPQARPPSVDRVFE